MPRRLLPLLVLAALAAGPAAAHATPPGTPGKVVWMSDRDGDFDIYVANPDGSGVVNLTNDDPAQERDVTPAWSPDGKRIVWMSTRDTGSAIGDLWIMNADGTGKANLTPDGAAVSQRNPSFSPDGKRIVLTFDDSPGLDDLDIAVINADGTGLQRLTDPQADTRTDQSPVFSPDGKQIFYSSFETAEANQVWRMNADGSGRTQLTSPPGQSLAQDVAPDGRSVLFISTGPDNTDFDPWLMNPDGTNQRPALDVPGNTFSATFSPSGQEVVFENETGSPPDDVDDLHLTRLGSGTSSLFPVSGPGRDNGLRWHSVPYRCGGRAATIVGTFGADKIRGTKGADVIVTLPGADEVKGLGGKDRICGGAGRDRLAGGKGNDILIGGAGRDRLLGGPGKDRLFGGTPGAKKSKKRGASDVCVGGPGADKESKSCR